MKMNISMDFVKPLAGAMRKYSALLPSMAITGAALLLFLPTMLVGNKVKDKMEQSAQKARTVRSLLQDVPSKYEPQQVKSYMDKLEDEVEKIKKTAIQSSQRNLVTYDYVIFPEPKDPSSQVYLEFGTHYSSAVEKLIQEMNALDAPSDSEIRARTGGGARPNYRMVNQTVDVQDPMVDALCLTRAQEISVYANPSAFSWYSFWEKYEFSGKDQALEDCWDSQVVLWIYEDIADTIRKMNGESGKVLTAPVKRLLGVSFSGPVVAESNLTRNRYSPRRGGLMQMRDIPNYVTPWRTSKFIPVSPTARISNQEVDIIHFAVSVIVDNRFVLSFMKELCTEKPHTFFPDFDPQGQPVESRHNQITILQSDLKVVDKSGPDHELYRYGKAAVVRLDLICEYQFERDGYDMIKPDPVKKRLGQLEEQSQDSQQMPGGSGMPGQTFEF